MVHELILNLTRLLASPKSPSFHPHAQAIAAIIVIIIIIIIVIFVVIVVIIIIRCLTSRRPVSTKTT